ncbi:outer membrane beta-barrel protein [Cryomorpha ignava]|uniref:Outer membrane beta-barrel protein n=1 Tax=Cryomorpha ignava TaxID=101383 RepID=A0A7K3WMM0_9FLAO|nr:outer membrane beta-barrel protein [Cryomorpha ignava]NEN22900.1 outer membrane beta-barrel protein [Cryomorpha ignava]
MKKLILGVATVVALMFTVTANAQLNYGNAGLEIAIPMGDFADAANFGIGGSGLYEVGITDNIAALANVGVLFYATEFDEYSFMQIPIQVGARYYITEQRESLFFGVLAGVHMSIASFDDTEVAGVTIEGDSDSQVNFSFAPEVGYFINENISISLKYQIVTAKDEDVDFVNPITGETSTTTVEGVAASYLGLRLAYSF